MLEGSIDEYCFDNRSAKKARWDFEQGKKNELLAIKGLVDYYSALGIVCAFDPVDPTEEWLDHNHHHEPDFYFYKGQEVHSIEVKVSTTGNFYNDLIFIKPNPFWLAQEYPSRYPNFKALVATKEKFTIITYEEFANSKLQKAEQWSKGDIEKKVFKFSIKRKWLDWINVLE